MKQSKQTSGKGQSSNGIHPLDTSENRRGGQHQDSLGRTNEFGTQGRYEHTGENRDNDFEYEGKQENAGRSEHVRSHDRDEEDRESEPPSSRRRSSRDESTHGRR